MYKGNSTLQQILNLLVYIHLKLKFINGSNLLGEIYLLMITFFLHLNCDRSMFLIYVSLSSSSFLMYKGSYLFIFCDVVLITPSPLCSVIELLFILGVISCQ